MAMRNDLYVPLDYAQRRADKRAYSAAFGYVIALGLLAFIGCTSGIYYSFMYYTQGKAQSQPVLVKSELSKTELRVLKVKGERHEKAY